MSGSSEYLDSVEVDNHAILYECRWNPAAAARVVPRLMEGLRHPDGPLLIRTLNALYRIGLPAEAAMPEVIPLVSHPDTVVARAAIMTVAAIGRNTAAEAVPALVSAAAKPELLREVMFALIAFESQARAGTKVLTTALSNVDHRIRQLALRGLEAVADDATLHRALEHALQDRSKAVQEYAQKVCKRIAKEAAAPGPGCSEASDRGSGD